MSAFRSRPQPSKGCCDLLPPERTAQPKVLRHFAPRREDIVDAEFVVLRDTVPQDRGPRGVRDSLKPATPPIADIRFAPFGQSFPVRLIEAAAAAGEHALRRIPENAFSALVAAVFVAVFAVCGGIAGLARATAPDEANMKPIDITHVTLTPQEANGMPVLLVNGILENKTGGSLAVPKIRADLMSSGRLVASTVINSSIDVIDAGHSRGFSAKLPHPGGKMPEVRLSFAAPAS